MESRETDIVLFGAFLASGGVERAFANLVPEWVAAGYGVEIVGYRSAVRFYPDELGTAVGFTHLGTTGKWQTALALWRHLWRRRPKVVLSTGHISNLVVAVVACLPLPARMRLYLNVQNDFVASRKDKTGEKRARKLRQVRRFYPRADGLLVTSDGLRQNLRAAAGLQETPISVIPNGVVTDALPGRAAEPVAHPWLSAERASPVILGAGRLKDQKDFPTLLRAFARLRARYSARLIVIGEGEERGALEALVEELDLRESIDMPGFVNNPYAWIARADVFALSSKWEGFGNVVAEALALGVPVVSTRCPSGPAEILSDGAYGRLVPTEDPEALAEALAATLEEGGLPPADAVAAAERFGAHRSAHAYLHAFGLG